MDSIEDQILDGINDLMDDIADAIFSKSQENIIKNKTSNSGFLLQSGNVKRSYLKKEINYSAPYACIAFGKNVRITDGSSNKQLNCISENDSVLSKDGRKHKVRRKINFLSVYDKPDLVCLKAEKTRTKKGLFLTSDHLVLTERCGQIVWEEAGMLNVGDIVFKPHKLAWNKGIGDVEKICISCGKKFTTRLKKLKYCSRECYHKHTSYNRNEGKHWKLNKEQRFNRSGKNNSAWKGGISKLPYGIEWNRLLKEEIKERDNHTCKFCGLREENYLYNFHVHHINGNKFDNSRQNLITLCPICHGKQQWRAAELVDINLNIFEPIKLIKAERINGISYLSNYKGAAKKTKLWDLSIDGENSFVANGILVHNSYIEFGTEPHMPPVQPLIAWAQKKLHLSEKGARQAAWGIAMKIKQEGTDPQPFLRPAVETVLHLYGRNKLGFTNTKARTTK